jgi:acyl transferase domain-containing protein/NADPH:quinone reductase-like Zn-dependent oxidoreductase/SAM-dependent methyltransferase/acyl carrier protein
MNTPVDDHQGGVRSEPRNGFPREGEPIAIIGIGCRFPGEANNPATFWALLRDGVDALTDIPTDRWDLRTYYDPEPGKSGKTNVRFGGFLKSIDGFDAHFFGISPREAQRMDPQQRLVLEVAWEALEDAGQTLDRLAGGPTGVFLGMSSFDYSLIQMGFRDRHGVDVYTNTGGALSIAANRISYCLNLKGPSVVVDTACSSALTAVHLACHALDQHECTSALAGGVHILITPGPYLGFSKLAMLSSDGRCKAFDAHANGFVRSEGAGMVLLKPLSRALADGDPIYAVIRASAINQDGRTTGLTVPSPQAQEDLVREAYRKARVDPRQVQYIEAHGTGTLVGDPIEARALGAVLAPCRPASEPCLVGSVKTNIGHLEAAAGVVGLIKTALALKHRQVPANLHFVEPNPDIPFEELRLRVPRTLEPWPAHEGPAIAGVNSFGFGGSNAHIVLQEAPAQKEQTWEPLADGRPQLIPLSARSPEALRAFAGSYEQFLKDAGADVSLRDFCHTTRLRRTHHDYRLGVVAGSTAELADRLGAFARGEANPGLVSDRALPGQQPKVAFVFSGQGPQWWAMGRQLLAEEQVFAEVIDRCDALIAGLGSLWSLRAELTAEESATLIQDTAIAQPAIFAVQAGLAALWRSWGIRPDAVVGHSVGEVAAAYAAGVLSLENAVRVIYHRGRCMALAPGGRMLAVSLKLEEAEAIVAPYGGRVTVAAINGPTALTLSGDPEPLEEIANTIQARQGFAKFLQVQYAFHSHHMEPVRDELLESLRGLRAGPAAVPLVSSVTGDWTDGTAMDADYWWRNVRQSVHFAEAVDRLLAADHNVFLEISPHPVLASGVAECAQARGKKVTLVPSLRRKEPERAHMLRALGALYAVGCPLDWHLQEGSSGRLLRLPSYPWQRERYWHESQESHDSRLGLTGTHPLLGRPLGTPTPSWMSALDPNWLPYLRDHKVQGQILVPGAAYVEMALAAAKEVFGPGRYVLEEVRFVKGCFLPKGDSRSAQTTYDPQDSTFQVYSQPLEPNQPWVFHASGVLRSRQDEREAALFEPAEVQARCTGARTGAECYEGLRKIGMDYGPTFQGIQQLWVGDAEALAQIGLTADLVPQLESYQFHPAALDACLQTILGTLLRVRSGEDAGQGVYLPVEIEEVRVYGRPGAQLWSHARLVEINRQGLVAQVQAYDENGRLILDIRNLRCQYLGSDGSPAETLDDLLYEFKWQLQPRPMSQAEQRRFGHLLPLDNVADHVQAELERQGLLRDLSRYDGLDLVINRLCGAYVSSALQELGAELQPGVQFEATALADRLGIAEKHRRLFQRYLTALAEDGVLSRQAPANGDAAGSKTWQVVRAPEYGDPQALWRDLLEHNPAFFAELTLIGRCGQNLAGVLQGTTNPLQLIFPDGSLALAEHLYSDSPSTRFYNNRARDALECVLGQVPPDRTLRVLEIGAGTGGLTSYLLPRLPAGRTEYVFTDLSNHFFIKAQQKFADFSFIQYQKLDIEKDPAGQEFANHSFDIIVASQVLHATTDLRQTLAHVRQLLAADGLLVLLEVVKPARWIDLVFGLTEGWWRFSDTDLRSEYPLLTFPRWKDLLGELGFTDVVDASASTRMEGFGSAVILARGPGAIAAEQTECAGTAEPATAAEKAAQSWLIFADSAGLGARLGELLRARGDRTHLVYAGDASAAQADGAACVAPNRPEELAQLLARFKEAGEPRPNVVHLWNLDVPAPEALAPESLDGAADLGCLSIVHLVQAWAEVVKENSRLWVITRGTQSVRPDGGFEAIAIGQTMVWGLTRVLSNEFPQLRCKIVDLEAPATDAESRLLLEELFIADEEDEIALRGEARYVHRFVHAALDKQSANGRTDTVPFRLDLPRFGVLDRLTLREVERVRPGPHQVEIRVEAAALNFSDVMKALGLYPGLPDGPVPLGIECAGHVTAVGADVPNVAVGDEVVALAPFSFGNYTVTYAPLVARKPKSVTFEEAATLPIAFLTAHYALNYLGRVTEGERVLIHAATGGVGLAALQLARAAGAEVFATAGSSEKRSFLRALGVEQVMDSRSLAFVDETLAATGGLGVDVVLNSLSGEAIGKGLGVLTDYGRFLEIGKRDIYMNSRLGMRPFKKNLSFIAIDLDRALRQKPAVIARLFQEMVRKVDEGTLRPLPHRVFSIGNIVGAFRSMAQAKHMGKIVISMEDAHVPIAPRAVAPMAFAADATYLITGGLGGFGLAVARWMVERGARHLVLVSRRGAHSPEIQQSVENLRQRGAEVRAVAADVSDGKQVAGILADIAATMPPLRGIVHAAMLLEDVLLTKLDRERLLRVLQPRVHGAWYLHTQTEHLPLDFFVCFSSMGSVFGLPGQTPYASSNTFLDSLAHHRRAKGLPGLTVNWGYLGEVGYVARNERLGERFEGQGLRSFSPSEATALLGRFLRHDPVQLGVVRMDWNRWRGMGAGQFMSPRFAQLAKEVDGTSSSGSADGAALRKMLVAAPPERRKEMLLNFLKDKVARVLGSSPDKIDLAKPLTDLGLDSLMAVELRNWVEGELRVTLPIAELLQGPTVDRLADVLLDQLVKADAGSAAPQANEAKPAPAALAPATGVSAVPAAAPVPANGNAGVDAIGLTPRSNGSHKLEIDPALRERIRAGVDALGDEEVDSLLETLQSPKEVKP